MDITTERAGLYAVMNRCNDILESLIGPHDQMEDFLQSYAYADYKAALMHATDERDPAILHGRVEEMNAALDRWGK